MGSDEVGSDEVAVLRQRIVELKRRIRWIEFQWAYEEGYGNMWFLEDADCDPDAPGLGGRISEDDALLRACLADGGPDDRFGRSVEIRLPPPARIAHGETE